ncbi:phage BR0599 family protein [Mesorhizobium sp. B2-1-2]|uniref:phage BR0599 family protein n=1 Tax=Mesorhizobium sp. B2-1-2 TaxID=2589973 RepID=UPI0017477F46|nr:phage BR0599 family protein [Mesorhizobium sp. B2-1-2]
MRNPNGVLENIAFLPWPIKHSDLSHDGTLDKSDIKVTLAIGSAEIGSDIDTVFLAYPPSQVVNLTIFEGHIGDAVTEANFPATWMGRIVSGGYDDSNQLELSCLPVSTKIKQPGLRRNYQIGCPHVLFGPQCRADKAAATVLRTVTSVTGTKIDFNSALVNPDRYVGGLLQWTNSDNGRKELRTIASVRFDGGQLTIRGLARGLAAGTQLSIARGCNRQMSGCNQHIESGVGGSNIHNYGGQPFIPLENPLSQKNQFY